MEYYQPSSQPKKKSFNLAIVILLILLLISVAAGTFLYVKYQAALEKANNPTEVLNEQSKSLVKKLSELMVIDEGIDPTIATVIDIAALKAENPEFYKNGKEGDIIFIYPTRVILYDKAAHKIINVAPIISGEEAPPSQSIQIQASPTPVASPVVVASPRPSPIPSPSITPTASPE